MAPRHDGWNRRSPAWVPSLPPMVLSMRTFLWVQFALLVLGLFLPTPGSWAATRIELVLDEPFADRAAPWPVTTGVPFPRGKLTSGDRCRLLDDQGQEQPLQTRVSATWDAEAKSVRWLTIDFISQPGRKYALEFGEEVTRKAWRSPLVVTPGASPNVATGPLAVAFAATGPASLASIAADLNGDGKIEPSEQVAAGAATGEHYYLDQTGQRFSSAADGAERKIVVETTGPVRACIRVDGFYTGPKGERIVKYRTRYHFFAGLPVVKAVDELGFIGSTKTTRFRDIGFALNHRQSAASRTITIDRSGEHGNQPLVAAWTEETQSLASFQTTYRHYGNPEFHAAVSRTTPQGAQVLAETDRMGEWLQTADGRSSITGSLRWFWQQFPKEWEATSSQLTLHLWSTRAGELDFGADGINRFLGPAGEKYLRAGQEQKNRNPLERFFYYADVEAINRGAADGLGINKHHEFWLHFGPANRQREAAEYARLAAQQPLALASGAWNCGTDVFGPLAARPNNSPYEAAVDRLFDDGRRMQDQFGDYGWYLFGAGPHYSYQWDPQTQRHFADSRRFEFHTYQKETQLWWNYLRSGERKFYDWAIPSENHWVDIAVAHEPTTIECGWKGGVAEQRTLHWRPGEWSIDSPTHYVRHHERAEAWLRGGAQFWGSYHRSLETTTLAYYLTGDERYHDVIQYWRDYWAPLAGKTSSSSDLLPWHKEQAWYRPTRPDEPSKTWAEMIRDYAPFRSGTRHNLTLFFNLATLYEHTWDPQIGQALNEYAAAFLDPRHPTGTWTPQDSRLPAHAEAPSMGHFWVPALWKYHRVTQDPRMPEIFARYFAAGYAADPFRDGEDVGTYSNHYPAYAYYFTRDPRYLALAKNELDQLLPHSLPLTKPGDINTRLYNPYAPARVFSGVPRLIWALETASQGGVSIPAQPLKPQRSPLALHKPQRKELTATFWGYDAELTLIGPDAQPVRPLTIQSERRASDTQPFDRVSPDFAVYLHRVVIPASAPVGFYIAVPKLELALLESSTDARPLWNAAVPLLLEPGQAVELAIGGEAPALALESALPAAVRVSAGGNPLVAQITGNRAAYALPPAAIAPLRIEAPEKPAWFRLADRPAEACWVAPRSSQLAWNPKQTPTSAQTAAALPPPAPLDLTQTFVPGRFGQAVQVAPGRALHIPDHLVQGETKSPLFDRRQGTLEFWVKKQWDERLTGVKQIPLLTNGLFTALNSPRLPLGEWAHVAIVWMPYHGDPQQTITYVYLNGRDFANYRSLNWAGYSSVRTSTGANLSWREELLALAPAGTAFAIDELRLSKTARYADPAITFGPQQTFNPFQFTPPAEPFPPDADTLLLLRFDDSLDATAPAGKVSASVGN